MLWQVTVESNKIHSDDDQLFAAGFVEAYLSAESIFNHNQNMLCQVREERKDKERFRNIAKAAIKIS